MALLPVLGLVWVLATSGAHAYDYSAIVSENLLDEVQYIPGDITIGAVLNIRDAVGVNQRGPVTNPIAPLLIYSYKYAIEHVNKNPALLPNTTLGSQLRENTNLPSGSIIRTYQLLSTPGVGPMVGVPLMNSSYQACAIIGPLGKETTVAVAAVTTLNKVLLVAPHGASSDLNNRLHFPYFYTPVAYGRVQDELILSILRYFKWKLFIVLYVSRSFAIEGLQYLSVQTKDTDYCIEESFLVVEPRGDNYKEIAQKLKFSKARVIVNLANNRYIPLILRGLRELGVSRRYFWVTRNSFDLSSIVGSESEMSGSIFTRTETILDPDLLTYLHHVNPVTYPHDVWLRDFWMNHYGCLPEAGTDNNTGCADHVLSDLVIEDYIPKLNRPVRSVYAVATAIHKVIEDNCPEASGDRDALHACVKPILLTVAIQQVEVVSPTKTFRFINQYAYENFEIYQFQISPVDGSLVRVRIGDYWDELGLVEIDNGLLDFNLNGTDIPIQENTTWPRAVCSYPCVVGEFRLQGELTCCWECYMCRDNEFVDANETGCISCPINTWPDNATRQFCVEIEPSYLLWSDPYGLTLACLASAGIISSTIILIIVIIKRKYRVIKGSTWYMLVIILLGIKLANACVYIHIAMPTDAMCITARLGFHLVFTLIFGPLMVKVNRIFQVFLASGKLSRKVRLASDTAQQCMVIVIILVQVSILVISLLFWPADAIITMPVTTENFTELHCSVPVNSLFICSSFNMLLLLACSILAFLARSLPDNFNESWYIFLSVATTVFIWIAFFTTYLSAFYAYHQAALLAAALILNALVVTVALFAPKIYALYYIPEKNIKVTDFDESNFTESTTDSVTKENKGSI